MPNPPTPPGSTAGPIALAAALSYSIAGPAANNLNITAAGADTLSGGDADTLVAAAGGNTITGHDRDVVTVTGGGNSISLHDNGSVTVNDARTLADGYNGSVTFSDAISVHNNDTINLNYTLNLGAADAVSVNFNPALTLGGKDTVNSAYAVNAGSSDVITFAGSGQAVTLNAGGGNTIMTSGANDTVTIGNSATANSSASTGGACSNGVIMTIGATAAGTTFNGGLGTDTFSAGAGYDGGNNYIGSMGSHDELFAGQGNCVNYSGLACRVTVNYNTGVGQGFDTNGKLLWTDTYTNMEQVKGAQLDGDVLTGSNAYFNELKGGLGQTTYHDGAAGDRVIWGEAGTTGLLDGKGTDIAYLGTGDDEIYWRNQPSNSKGVSNFGETVYGFNAAQGDDLNLTEFGTAGFAGVNKSFAGANDVTNWVNVSLSGGDTNIWFDRTGSGKFTQVAATLKNDNLFSDFGVNSQGPNAAQTVVQDLYNSGNLVMNQSH